MSNGHNADSRDALESRADAVLSQLLRRLDVLDERRHQLKAAGGLVKYEVKRHLPITIAVGVGAIALGVVVARAVQAHREREFQRQIMRRLLGRLLGDGAVEAPRRPSALGLSLRAAGLRVLMLAGSELGRRVLNRRLGAAPHQERYPELTHAAQAR